MIKTDTKIAEQMDQEFNFGSLDIGNELDVDELNTITPVEDEDKPEESDEESPEESPEESNKEQEA